jgi:Spy/CpxP family protein refolding chaperone
MKRTIFLLGLMLFVGIGTAVAQRGNGRPQGTVIVNRSPQRPPITTTSEQRIPEAMRRIPESPGNSVRKVTFPRDLGLSDLQQRQIKQIFKHARETGATKREVYQQILRVLTPEQEEKFRDRIKHLFGID